jgi:hypothetical protein
VTHEHVVGIGGEPPNGPQSDRRLPYATDIPIFEDVEDSLAPPIVDVSSIDQYPGTEYLGAEPGWWQR